METSPFLLRVLKQQIPLLSPLVTILQPVSCSDMRVGKPYILWNLRLLVEMLIFPRAEKVIFSVHLRDGPDCPNCDVGRYNTS